MIENPVVAFTGHRPNKLGGYLLPNAKFQRVVHKMYDALVSLKPSKVISGMALGVDQWAAELALDLGIPLIAAIPFEGQQGKWPYESQRKFQSLLDKATSIITVSEGGYSAYKMQVRNEWMVLNSDILIAVWDGTSGGTGNCVSFAKGTNHQIYRIDPNE